MHRARETGSFEPKARAALRSERPGSHEIAELRHRDASQRKRRRIVAQRDTLQRAERITGGQRACRSRDQRVHFLRNPATLVTPTLSMSVAKTIPSKEGDMSDDVTQDRDA